MSIINGTARLTRSDDYPWGLEPSRLDSFRTENTEPKRGPQPGGDVIGFLAPSMATDPDFRLWWDRAGRRGASPATARSILAVIYQADVRPLLPSIRVPTLVLQRGEIEATFGPGHGRYLADHIPDTRYVELEEVDSLYWVGETDQMLDEIEEFLTGERPGPITSRVLATVLFTDIVGSTEIIARTGDRHGRDVLDHHDAVIARQLKRFAGHQVKTLGDGVLATFDGPARAALCALAIRDELHEAEIEIRAGIHTGEVEQRGDDIAGIAVHIAARIEALAGAGEILASRTLKDLVVGSGLQFTDRGTHELKGVPDTWQLYSVMGA